MKKIHPYEQIPGLWAVAEFSPAGAQVGLLTFNTYPEAKLAHRAMSAKAEGGTNFRLLVLRGEWIKT